MVLERASRLRWNNVKVFVVSTGQVAQPILEGTQGRLWWICEGGRAVALFMGRTASPLCIV